jgi:hypothetical protein
VLGVDGMEGREGVARATAEEDSTLQD